jgi:hypothetical protein
MRTVQAVDNVEVVVVKREVLSNALGMHSWMGVFVKALADRLREAEERLRAGEARQGRPGGS